MRSAILALVVLTAGCTTIGDFGGEEACAGHDAAPRPAYTPAKLEDLTFTRGDLSAAERASAFDALSRLVVATPDEPFREANATLTYGSKHAKFLFDAVHERGTRRSLGVDLVWENGSMPRTSPHAAPLDGSRAAEEAVRIAAPEAPPEAATVSSPRAVWEEGSPGCVVLLYEGAEPHRCESTPQGTLCSTPPPPRLLATARVRVDQERVVDWTMP